MLEMPEGPAEPLFRISKAISAPIQLLVAQHYPSPHLAATLQIAQRGAGLVCRTRLNRDWRDLASLNEREKLLQILERADIRALDGHHLKREQYGRDRAGSAVKPDHDELAALSQDVDTKLHGLGGADKIDRRSGPAISRFHYLFHCVG